MLSLLIDSILHIISDLLHVKQLISYHIHFCELSRNAKICRRWWLHSDNFMKVHECFLRRNGTFLKRRIEKRRISWFIKWRDKDPWKTMPNLTLLLKKSSLKNQWTNLGTLVTLVVLILVDYGFCLLSFSDLTEEKVSPFVVLLSCMIKKFDIQTPFFFIIAYFGRKFGKLNLIMTSIQTIISYIKISRFKVMCILWLKIFRS